MTIYGWNIVNSFLPITTYINTSIILLCAILLGLLSSTLFRTYQSLCIVCSSMKHPALRWLAGINFTGLITCLAIITHVALFILAKTICWLCPSFYSKAFERQQEYVIWSHMWCLIVCPCVDISKYSSCSVSCSRIHLMIDNWTYGPFRPQLLLM